MKVYQRVSKLLSAHDFVTGGQTDRKTMPPFPLVGVDMIRQELLLQRKQDTLKTSEGSSPFLTLQDPKNNNSCYWQLKLDCLGSRSQNFEKVIWVLGQTSTKRLYRAKNAIKNTFNMLKLAN